MSQQSKPTSFLVLLVVLAVTLLLVSSLLTPNTAQTLQYSDVLDLFRNEKVASFTLEGSSLTMKVRGENDQTSTMTAKIGDTAQFREDLDALIAEQYASGTLESYNYLPASEPWLRAAAPYIIGGIVLIAVFFFLSSRANGGPNGMANFTKANARFGIPTNQTVTFQDVAGADEEKQELAQIVDFLQDPKRYARLGAKIPKGVLLVGPPGTGKTLLARAVAGEAGVSFLSISGSDFVELYVGVGASRVRDLFDQAKKVAPAIVFIDEIDAVGRRRGAGLGGGHDEREQTLNQLLVEMDGFSSNTGVIVIAATNRKDILDPALLRPGRFDRQIYVGSPDWRGREEILKVHAKDKPLADNVNLEALAKATAGFTGADLANLLNEAALLAAGKNRAVITMKDMEEAMIKVIAGPEKRSRVVSQYERRLTAFHEAGHAIAMYCLPTQDPVHMITIVPRGMAGGMTISLPQDDQSFVSRTEMFETIVGFLGGRVAEQLKLDDISTGASNDIQRATAIARDMVSKYAMSDNLGPVSYSSGNEVFIGRDYEKTKSYSESVAGRIDDEVQSILTKAYEKCTDILRTHDQKLESVASYLMAHNNMGRAQFEAVMEGKPVPDADVLPIESIEQLDSPGEDSQNA